MPTRTFGGFCPLLLTCNLPNFTLFELPAPIYILSPCRILKPFSSLTIFRFGLFPKLPSKILIPSFRIRLRAYLHFHQRQTKAAKTVQRISRRSLRTICSKPLTIPLFRPVGRLTGYHNNTQSVVFTHLPSIYHYYSLVDNHALLKIKQTFCFLPFLNYLVYFIHNTHTPPFFYLTIKIYLKYYWKSGKGNHIFF